MYIKHLFGCEWAKACLILDSTVTPRDHPNFGAATPRQHCSMQTCSKMRYAFFTTSLTDKRYRPRQEVSLFSNYPGLSADDQLQHEFDDLDRLFNALVWDF